MWQSASSDSTAAKHNPSENVIWMDQISLLNLCVVLLIYNMERSVVHVHCDRIILLTKDFSTYCDTGLR